MVNLDEQKAPKELIKLQQQTEKVFDTDFMKQLAQNSRVMAETTKKAGLRSQFEQLHKQIVAVAPEMFQDITVEQPEAETHQDKKLRLLAEYQAYCREVHEEFDDFDFDSLWECSDEMRFRTNQLQFDTYADAYRFAVKHYTVKGKPIKSIDQLDVEYFKAKNRHPETLKTYSSDWDK